MKLVGIRPDGTLRLTAVYAAFEMVSQLALGSAQIVETVATAPIDAMAINNPATPQLELVIANGRAEPANVDVLIEESPLAGQSVALGLQQIDSARSVDGAGLEPPRWQSLGVSPRNLRITISLPAYGSALLTVLPATSRRRAVRA